MSLKEYYGLSVYDATLFWAAFEEKSETEILQLRHLMWASLAPWVKGITPQKIIRLPSDKKRLPKPMTKEEFIWLGEKFRPKAKA